MDLWFQFKISYCWSSLCSSFNFISFFCWKAEFLIYIGKIYIIHIRYLNFSRINAFSLQMRDIEYSCSIFLFVLLVMRCVAKFWDAVVGPKYINQKYCFLATWKYERNLHETHILKSDEITKFQDLKHTFFHLDLKWLFRSGWSN